MKFSPMPRQIYAEVKRPKGASVHILTGPIYVDGAEPGDTLEVRVHDIKFRVPYGVNNTGPGKGVLPKLLKEASGEIDSSRSRTARRAVLRRYSRSRSIRSWASWRCRRRRVWGWFHPRRRALGAAISISSTTGIGSSLFLPVFNKGGQFFTGDGHAVQGDGEVDGGAIEISLKPTLQFIVHKGKTIKQPRVETATDYLTTGLDVDLNVATESRFRKRSIFSKRRKA